MQQNRKELLAKNCAIYLSVKWRTMRQNSTKERTKIVSFFERKMLHAVSFFHWKRAYMPKG